MWPYKTSNRDHCFEDGINSYRAEPKDWKTANEVSPFSHKLFWSKFLFDLINKKIFRRFLNTNDMNHYFLFWGLFITFLHLTKWQCHFKVRRIGFRHNRVVRNLFEKLPLILSSVVLLPYTILPLFVSTF